MMEITAQSDTFLMKMKYAFKAIALTAVVLALAGCAGSKSSTVKNNDSPSPASNSKLSGKRLVDSKDYNDKNFRKGCMNDYSDLVKAKGAGWAWISPGYNLSQYNIKIGSIENRSQVKARSLTDAVRATFTDNLSGNGGNGSQTLTANLCIYDAEHYNPGKAHIPFSGGYLMQAGIGVEMVLTSNGKAVAKFRDFTREGARIEDAARKLAHDYMKFISKN